MKTWVEEKIDEDEIGLYELDNSTKCIGEVGKDRFEFTRNINLNTGIFHASSITPKIRGQILSKTNSTQIKRCFTTAKIAGWIYACLILLPFFMGVAGLENFGPNVFLSFMFTFGISRFYFGEKALILHCMKKELALKELATA